MDYKNYYILGERIHESLLEVHSLKDEMKQLDKMLEDIQKKLNTTIDIGKAGALNS